MDVFSLDQLTDYDFGHTHQRGQGGRAAGFPGYAEKSGAADGIGRRFLDGDINVRKTIFRDQLKTLGTFKFVIQLLNKAQNHRLTKEIIMEELAVRLTTEDVEKVFDTVVNWGRFGELFGYEATAEELYLDVDGGAGQLAAAS